MDRDTARQEIQRRISCKDYLTKSKSGMYCCPICGSGTGKNKSGALKLYNTNTWYCHACKTKGDVLDLIRQKYGTDYNGALKIAADQLGITIDPYRPEGATDQHKKTPLPSRSGADQTEEDTYNSDMERAEIESSAVKQAFIYWHNGQELPGMLNKWLHDNTDYEFADSIQDFYCDYGLLNKDGTISEYGQAAIEAEKPALRDAQDGANIAEDKNPVESTKAPENAAGMHTAADYTAYYQECRQRLNDPAAAAYLQSRGISMETAAAYWLGFDPQADPAKSNHPCPRLIIPTSKAHYVGRRIDGVKEYDKLNPKGSTPAIFNARVLYSQDVQEVFVTEGVFDALSIIECGGAAVALNSTSNADKFIEQLETRPTKSVMILCLDNDDAGKKAAPIIKDGLTRLNISYITADIAGRFKDPNEALTGDREAFIKAIRDAEAQAAAKPDNITAYIDNLMYGDIERLKAAADRKTGFKTLDEKSGGLYPGLYVVAATSSLGKTTFALQIADNLAAAGHEVLFFSMEQSRLELVTKSFTRILAQEHNADVNSLALRKGYYSDKLKQAAAIYKEKVGDRLSIIEGNFNCNISFIGDYVRRYIRRNNSRPVVFIDYLQILQPADDARTMSLKETVDNTVTELKRISREHDLTVFVVSSVNRANYMTPIDFEALKESGGIEYTADVIWGLQLECLNDPLFDTANKIKEKRQLIRREKAADPRKIELLCLKNRYGIANFVCGFNYYPARDLFVNMTDGEFMAYYGKVPFENAGEDNSTAGNNLPITARF